MNSKNPLNLFYEEPTYDRWIKNDRYPRKLLRNLIRGKANPGGVMMVALNLMQGLDKLKIPYRYNDYRYINKHPQELACIIGKTQLLFERQWKNPILFGAGVFSHPIECPDLFEKYPQVKHLLVPGEWMCKMFEPYYGSRVSAWPTGIDTERWKPSDQYKSIDFLIYDKIRWNYEHYEETLLLPIIEILNGRNLSYQIIRYGKYSPNELLEKLNTSKSVIFLCEHETQGLAYQQVLSSNIPIIAWDKGGYWQDPYYFPSKVRFKSVSSVPYWDDRCGVKFNQMEDFEYQLECFLHLLSENKFNPQQYIKENLTLEKCALKYAEIAWNLALNDK